MRSLLFCAAVGAVFGYFVFFGRVQSWIVPILTLAFTLLLETFLGQTAGYQWRIGHVQLGGYNGMTGIPSFQLGQLVFMGYPFYYYTLAVVVVCFLGCRMLVGSHYGRVLLAIRPIDVAAADDRVELIERKIRNVHGHAPFRAATEAATWPELQAEDHYPTCQV